MNRAILRKGRGPFVLGMPHIGTGIPPKVLVALNDIGRNVPDTDLWIDRLCLPVAERLAATVIAAVLRDCQSIRGTIPHLFESDLPVLNLDTNAGAACSPRVREAAVAHLYSAPFSQVADGRFKGGWIPRHYGQPARGMEAPQMELAQHAYMDEAPPWTFRADRAALLADVLADTIAAVRNAARETHA
jgi:N-formylglutamate amidohydrolase